MIYSVYDLYTGYYVFAILPFRFFPTRKNINFENRHSIHEAKANSFQGVISTIRQTTAVIFAKFQLMSARRTERNALHAVIMGEPKNTAPEVPVLYWIVCFEPPRS